MAALTEIWNDPDVDCPDVVVGVREVSFGKTVRTIYCDFTGFWKDPERAREADERDKRESEARGQEGAYDDLTDVAALPHLRETVVRELQKRLGLPYRPTLRVLSNLRRADDL